MLIKILKKYYYLLISLILIIWLIFKVDINSLFNVFSQINLFFWFVGILFTLPNTFVKSLRWRYLNKVQNINYNIFNSFSMYTVAMAIGSLTPARVAEVIKVFYLKKDGYSARRSIPGIILDRSFDIALLIILSLLSSILFFQNWLQSNLVIYIFLAILIVFLFLFIKNGWYVWILKKIYTKIIPKKYQEKILISFNDFWENLNKYLLKDYLVVGGLSLISWFFYYCQIYFFILAININIPPLYLMAGVTLAALISSLPISFIGIGTREATLVILLRDFSTNIAPLIILSQLILADYIFDMFFGIIMSLFKPVPSKKYESKN